MSSELSSNDKFPFRSLYTDVEIMSVTALHKNYESAVIIDVRSVQECSVIKINKAHCLPWSNRGFDALLSEFRSKLSNTPLVFYCNGHTCRKSYNAARTAIKKDFSNVFSMDAGIFDWAKAYPQLTTLLGETPLNPEKLISKTTLKSKKITFEQLLLKTQQDPNLLVIDIREPRQRNKKEIVINDLDIRPISFNNMVENIIKKGQWINKTIVIIDAVGKQVRWLQYYLESHHYQSYFFLDKGVSNLDYLKHTNNTDQ